MELRTALYIYLPLDATSDEIEAAHNIIDGQFGVNPQTIISNNATPGTVVNNSVQTAATTSMGGAVVAAAVAEGLDVNGLPWDERIHSSNRKKNDKGGWWSKRGTDANYKAKIEAELRASMGVTPPTATPAAAPAPSLPSPTAAATLPPVPGTAQPDPAYTALVQLIAQNTHSDANPAGRLTADWVKQVLEYYQVPDGSLQNLAHAPQLVAPVAEYIAKALAG